jgi:CRISPR-associated protein Cas5d
MPKTLCLKVWGDFACFTRPEMKVERVSYDVITPSAARAIFEAILWKPEIRWCVTRIEVLNPVKWISVRRNEVSCVAGCPDGYFVDDIDSQGKLKYRQQRAGLFLRDVAYRLHADFEVIDSSKHLRIYPGLHQDKPVEPEENQPENPAKYLSMFQRRARKGQCAWQPYLGCREFSAHFELIEDIDLARQEEPPIPDSPDLGWMLHDIDYADGMRSGFFRAEMKHGVIALDAVEVRR